MKTTVTCLVLLSAIAMAEEQPQQLPKVALPSSPEQAVAQAQSVIDAANRVIAAKLDITSRTRDPFGLSLSDTVSPTAMTRVEDSGSRMPTLVEVVSGLKVNGADPTRGEIYIQSRQIKENDVIKIRSKGYLFSVTLLEVGANNIVYSNTETGERAVVKLGITPQLKISEQQEFTNQ